MPNVPILGRKPEVRATLNPDGSFGLSVEGWNANQLFVLAGRLERIANAIIDSEEMQAMMAQQTLENAVKENLKQ